MVNEKNLVIGEYTLAQEFIKQVGFPVTWIATGPNSLRGLMNTTVWLLHGWEDILKEPEDRIVLMKKYQGAKNNRIININYFS